MGQEVLSQINRTVRAFVTHDRDLAKEVIEEDAEVNEYEVKLEKKSFEIIALLAGSRKQEIKDNLPSMLEAARHFEDYQMVVAAAPSIAESYYKKYLGSSEAKMVKTQTYKLLSHATVALVTSGTATLETALLNVPQVVCYETPVPKLIRFAFKHIIKVRFISLVNLIADKEIVQELLADRFSIRNIANELYRILPGQPSRERMLADYQYVRDRLGNEVAPGNAARIMVEKLISSHANQYVNRQINESTNEQVCELVSEQYETLTHEHTDHNGEVLIGGEQD